MVNCRFKKRNFRNEKLYGRCIWNFIKINKRKK